MKKLQINCVSFLVLSLVFKNCICLNKLYSQNEKEIDDLILCARRITEVNFRINSTVAFHAALRDRENNHFVLNAIMSYIMNRRGTQPQYTMTTACVTRERKPNYYVVVTTSTEEFSIFVDKERKCPDWNVGANYFIVSTSINSFDLQEMFRIAWLHKIFNIAIIHYNATKNRAEILTWTLPCKHLPTEEETKHLNRINCNRTKEVFTNKWLFPYPGCLFKAAVNSFPPFTSYINYENSTAPGNFNKINHYSGVEIELIKYICEELNLTAQLISSDKSNINIVLDLILDDELDVLIGDVKARYFKLSEFAFTYPHYYDEIHAVIDKESYRDLIDEIIGVFQIRVQIIYVSIFIIFYVSYVSIILFAKNFRTFSNDVLGALTSAWAIQLGLPTTLPKKMWSVSALLILMWTWMAFYSRTVFQSALINILSDVVSRNRINTVQELCQENLTIIVPDVDDIHMLYANRSFSDGVCKFKKEDFVECLDMSECLEYVLLMPAFATFVSINFYKSQKWELLQDPRFRSSTFHVIKEPIFSSPLAFQFKRGNPLVDQFSYLSFRFTEAGFMQYHLQKVRDHENLLRAMYKNNSTDEFLVNFRSSKFQQLTMYHMTPILKLLGVGYLLSFGVALLEIITFYLIHLHQLQR